MIVCPLHWYYRQAHLDEVAAEMNRRGPPTLHGHLDNETGMFFLREGTHRIRAAHQLKLAPTLVLITWWRARDRLVSARIAARSRGLNFNEVTMRDHLESEIATRIDPLTVRPDCVVLDSKGCTKRAWYKLDDGRHVCTRCLCNEEQRRGVD